MKSATGIYDSHPGLKGFSLIIAVLLAIVIFLGVVGLISRQTLLNQQYNQQIIQNQHIDQRISEILPELLLKNSIPGNIYPAISTLLLDPAKGITTKLIPTVWVDGLAKSVVVDFIDFMKSNQETFTISLGMSDFKNEISSQSAELTNLVIGLMPACTADQMLTIAKDALTGGTSNLPFCKPADPFSKLLTPFVKGGISALISRIPLEIKFDVFTFNSGNVPPALVTGIKFIRFLEGLMKYVVPFVILLVIILFWVYRKAMLTAFQRIGISFLITGAGLLTFAAVLHFSGMSSTLLGNALNTSAEISSIAADYIDAMSVGVAIMAVKISLLMFAGGAVLVFAARRGKIHKVA